MFEFAQTNLQLLDQARQRGLSAKELIRISRAYWGAIPLFSAMYRGSGKPILSHLVGTASVLLATGARIDTVLAGLLHAAYALGNFGGGEEKQEQRTALGSLIGDDAERIVRAYTSRPWNVQSIRALAAEASTLSPLDRQVVIVRLANEVDDHLNSGVLYCANGPERRDFIERSRDSLLAIAETLGQTDLRGILERAISDCLAADVSPDLRGEHRYSYVHPPNPTLDPLP